jgi:hypothetical protein
MQSVPEVGQQFILFRKYECPKRWQLVPEVPGGLGNPINADAKVNVSLSIGPTFAGLDLPGTSLQVRKLSKPCLSVFESHLINGPYIND